MLDRSTATQPASTKSESDFNLDFNLPMSETHKNNFSKAGGCLSTLCYLLDPPLTQDWVLSDSGPPTLLMFCAVKMESNA